MSRDLQRLQSSCLSLQALLHEELEESECKEWDLSLQKLIAKAANAPLEYFTMVCLLEDFRTLARNGLYKFWEKRSHK